MSKTIVFGASGFVGRSLMKLLAKDGARAVGHSSATLDLAAHDAVAKIAEAVEEGDSVILLSALTPEKGKAIDLTFKNLRMIRHVLAGIEGRALAQFIYVSSDAVYPLTADMIDELTPTTAMNLYGQMHIMREQMAREYFAPEQLTILRPCAIYGDDSEPHNAYSINRFIRSARAHGRIELFGGGEEYRDHIHVDDFAALIAVALKDRIAGTYNAASGRSWRFSEIAAAVRDACGGKVDIVHKPRALPISHRHVDMTLTRAAFPGWAPRGIGDGIARLMREAA